MFGRRRPLPPPHPESPTATRVTPGRQDHLTSSSKTTTRCTTPPTSLTSHTHKRIVVDPFAASCSPVAGSAKARHVHIVRVSLEHEELRTARGQIPGSAGLGSPSHAQWAQGLVGRVVDPLARHPALAGSVNTTSGLPPIKQQARGSPPFRAARRSNIEAFCSTARLRPARRC